MVIPWPEAATTRAHPAELVPGFAPTSVCARIASIICLASEEDGETFRWLEVAGASRDPGLLWMQGDPLLTGLTAESRYAALLRTLNLPQ